MDSQPSDSGDRNANRWEDTRTRRLDRSSDNAPAPGHPIQSRRPFTVLLLKPRGLRPATSFPSVRGPGWSTAWSPRSTDPAAVRSGSPLATTNSAGPPPFFATSDRESAMLSAKSSPSRMAPARFWTSWRSRQTRNAPETSRIWPWGSSPEASPRVRVQSRPRCASGSTSCLARTSRPRPSPRPSPASIQPRSPPPRWRPACGALLESCPSWLDLSPLTFQLAEEIRLREGSPSPDPARDSGIYRFLFERRLIGRLELYRRMLVWMAWFWRSRRLDDLSTLALACATQLSDEQYAVPSHPFTVELTTRSLLAAQHLSRTGIDPSRRE